MMTMTMTVFFFLRVNLKSAREPHFFRNVHGHVFAFTGTFSENSRASRCVHGHFFGLFHGHFSWFTGRKLGKCSRALFGVHGHIFLKSTKNAGIYVFTGTFRRFTGTFFWKCSRALLRFTGTFLGSRARFFSKVHGQLQDVHGHFYEIVHGHFLNVHA